jgi:hypothetical protein
MTFRALDIHGPAAAGVSGTGISVPSSFVNQLQHSGTAAFNEAAAAFHRGDTVAFQNELNHECAAQGL